MKEVVDFIFETGCLKRVDRSGWWLLGIKDPETVAEHSFRAAIIGYVLGRLEGADACKVSVMCLLQDVPEARLNDMHKVGQRYVDFKDAERKAFDEQVCKLSMREDMLALFNDYHTDGSREGILARDADLLECAFQAREYLEQGYDASDWLRNTEGLLRADSAKAMFTTLKDGSSHDWWKGLKKIGR